MNLEEQQSAAEAREPKASTRSADTDKAATGSDAMAPSSVELPTAPGRAEGSGFGAAPQAATGIPLAEILGSLRAFSRSPLRHWGIRRPRAWIRWVGLFVFLLLTVVPMLYCLILLAKESFGPSSFGTRGAYDVNLYFFAYAHLHLLLLFGAAVPLLLIVPWRLAMRFGDFWTPQHLREVVVTGVPALEILWGVVVPPIRPLVRWSCCIVAFYVFGAISFFGVPEGRDLAGVFLFVGVLLELFFQSALVNLLLVIAIGQRGRQTGGVIFVKTLLWSLLVHVILLALLWAIFSTFRSVEAAPFILPLVYLVPLLALKNHAFGTLEANLAERAGG